MVENKINSMKELATVVRKAARTINRHIDKGDFTPNMDKVWKVNASAIMLAAGFVSYFECRGMGKHYEYAKMLKDRMVEIRTARKRRDYTNRVDWVAKYRLDEAA